VAINHANTQYDARSTPVVTRDQVLAVFCWRSRFVPTWTSSVQRDICFFYNHFSSCHTDALTLVLVTAAYGLGASVCKEHLATLIGPRRIHDFCYSALFRAVSCRSFDLGWLLDGVLHSQLYAPRVTTVAAPPLVAAVEGDSIPLQVPTRVLWLANTKICVCFRCFSFSTLCRCFCFQPSFCFHLNLFFLQRSARASLASISALIGKSTHVAISRIRATLRCSIIT
jgi:hypothetical protein